jgi:hypothetical protein
LYSSSISKETIKTFLLFFCVGGIIVLSIHTFLIIQNQSKILENQEKFAKPIGIDNNERIKNIEIMLSGGNLTSPSVPDSDN